ncbi:hypothetical protein OW763_03070 [Clostridium aestuarii]|uniref:MarR family transcriptional regulator n=1 Tax=Clostridium aestuarii TaxID=338193 RepID=A0ABT4CZV2_9CLOT|nr:hypothetical protein [Clostridium aestuarii]MCY6483338.1 hypothetical protein [Clostridium aestuarii]
MYDKLKKSHKPYAKKIMYELYPDKNCNVDTLCSRFVKKRHKIVLASIKDLEKCRLIERVNNKDNEQLYMLTHYGKDFMKEEFNE